MKSSTLFAYTVRLASLAFGGFVVMISMPLALLGGAAPSDQVRPFFALLILPVAACCIASGFIYIGALGHRMARSRLHYVFAGLLLTAPLALGIWLLTRGHEWQPVGLFFCVPAALVFACAIWPLHVTSETGEAQTGTHG